MDLTIQIIQIIFYIVGIIFMISLSIISIWSFIVFKKSYKTKQIQNYILNKIYNLLSHSTLVTSDSTKDSIINKNQSMNELVDEENLFSDDTDDVTSL